MTTAGGSMWYIEADGSSADYIGNMTTSGTTTDYHTQVGANNMVVDHLTTGPDGNVWFDGCVSQDAYSGSLNVSTGALTYYYSGLNSSCGDNAAPGPIATGPDGNVWYSIQDYTLNNEFTYLFSVNPSSGTTTQTWATSAQTNYNSMTTGPDGRLWLSSPTAGSHGIIDALTVSSGSVTGRDSYIVPTAYKTPVSLVSGPDGNLWFIEAFTKIVKVTTSGSFTEYTMPTGVQPGTLVAGDDGALWFTTAYPSAAQVGRMTTSGTVTTYAVPGSNITATTGIALGSEGAVWFGYRDTSTTPMTYGLGKLGF